ncbi:YqcC family protein [Neptunicella sp.]|uniref:YqcC family protein n=1 Tax=Neptunicella sp. TaxID=2125986 RepID=UPI003F692D3A
MDKINDYQQIDQLLTELQRVMQHHQLWNSQLPEPQRLTSTAPFCCDVMEFDEWLQFVFLPKMYDLIEYQQPLPTKIALLPMGEYSWAGKADNGDLLGVLHAIDELLGKD